MMVLVKLILAHIIGDFFLQRGGWIVSKEQKAWRSPYLFLHVFIHFILLVIVFWDFSIWPAALTITILHYLIDGCKLSFQTEHTKRLWFGVDQAAHFVVLVAAWMIFWETTGIEMTTLSNQFWVLLTGLLFLTFPSSFIMQNLMEPWSHQIDMDKTESLKGAGEYIGMLERVFVYLALITGSAQVIGFLLAAKSIFRFGDLTRSKDRKLTEYILIGTLFSFLIAIVVGLISQNMMFV